MSLQVRHLVKHFDGVQAVKDLSFDVQAGQCVALIGPNGAGKSSTFACIAGQLDLTGGEVLWDAARIDRLSPAQRLQRGVTRTFQVAQTFEALSVLQNVQLLLQAPRGLSGWHALDPLQLDAARALLGQVGLLELAHADVLSLPYGAKKRLELALALAGVRRAAPAAAHLLLLDEPAAGLAGVERAHLMRLVKSLALGESGRHTAVLYTEHNMDAVFGVADRVLVLVAGQLLAQGSPTDIASNEVVRRLYLGQTDYAAGTEPDTAPGAQS
jgi:branched-chain amino acid transport system ATP-binding protein